MTQNTGRPFFPASRVLANSRFASHILAGLFAPFAFSHEVFMTHKATLTPPPTHAELVTILEKHLWYELARFVHQYGLLREPDRYRKGLSKDDAEDVEDALIVSFCTHARNLLEFVWRPNRTQFNYAIAIDYADASYVKLDRERPDIKRLYGQLCEQVNHLGLNRADKDHGKIQSKERDELVGIIHDEFERLVAQHLQPGFDKQYFGLKELAEAKRKSTMIQVGVQLVMSNLLLQQATHTTTPQLSSSVGPILSLKPQGPTGPTGPSGPIYPSGPAGSTGPAKPPGT
jgi:hypothetical protein